MKDSFVTFLGFLSDEFTESGDGFLDKFTRMSSNKSTGLFFSIFANVANFMIQSSSRGSSERVGMEV